MGIVLEVIWLGLDLFLNLAWFWKSSDERELQTVSTGRLALAAKPNRTFLRSAGARCPVCSESVTGTVRECARCGAPHHDACWTYNGRCAVYGCAGDRSEYMARPRAATECVRSVRLGAGARRRVTNMDGQDEQDGEPAHDARELRV